MRLGIDAMGGDHAPEEVIRGVLLAKEVSQATFVLYGDEAQIRPLLNGTELEIIHCSQVISNDDKPVDAVRRLTDSSMVKGLMDLKTGTIDGFLSAGNTGALLAGGVLRTGRIRGIERPAIASIYPMKDHIGMLCDAGANADVKPENLVDFATMSSFYAAKVLNIKNPTVGLANIGAEEGKGNELMKAAFLLLKEAPIHFIGNVEGRDIPEGKADIIVCDGFTGNIILKLTEGLAITLTGWMKELFLATIFTKLSSVFFKKGLKAFKAKLDYTEYGGAPLLGVNGYLVKAHGSSNAKAFKNALLYLEKYVQSNIVDDIKTSLGGN